jgi:flagellar biosynthesis protein FlhG
MATVLALASGKGGVGKTVLAANLAFLLTRRRRSVVLADLDWGGSNAHTVLGVLNNREGLGRYLLDKTRPLAEFVVTLDNPGLKFLPGDGMVAGGANVSHPMKHKLLRELAALDADYVVADLGAGSHSSTVDAFLSASVGLVVVSPEPTSLLNAYSFLKTALYRLMNRSVPAKSPARPLLAAHFTGRSQRTDGKGLDELVQEVRRLEPAHGERLAAARQGLRPRVVVNMTKDDQELNLGAKLRQVCERQLGLAVEYVSVVPWDEGVRTSVIERHLLCDSRPDSPFALAVSSLADRIVDTGFENTPPWGTYYDLEGL